MDGDTNDYRDKATMGKIAKSGIQWTERLVFLQN